MQQITPQTRGIIGVYKPVGPSSHAIISRLRKITGEKRIGHAGTLDPLASGVLVIGIGREWTKKLSTEVAKEKEYVTTLHLGWESTTDDAEGEKTEIPTQLIPTLEEVEHMLPTFIGEISQVPPIYSALKIQGKPAYSLARKGKEVVMKARMVVIKHIELLEYTWPYLTLRVVTGPGVYIRSLARDMGRALQTGAFMKTLERTRVGEYTKVEAFQLPDLLLPRQIVEDRTDNG